MTTPADVAVIPRDIRFRTDSAHGTAWLGGDPVAQVLRKRGARAVGADRCRDATRPRDRGQDERAVVGIVGGVDEQVSGCGLCGNAGVPGGVGGGPHHERTAGQGRRRFDLPGALLGARLTGLLSPRQLMRAIAMMLVVAGAAMLVQAFV